MGVLSHTLVALVAAAATLAALLNQPHLIQTAARLQPLVQQLRDAWTPPVGHRWNAHKVTLSQFQNSWAAEHAPVLTVRSGECVEVHASDASGGQVTRDSTTASLEGFDWGRVNPVHGPVAVEGAEPGDLLQVEVLRLDLDSFGWTAVIPGFGILSAAEPPLDAVNGPALVVVDVPPWYSRWIHVFGVRVPFSPHVRRCRGSTPTHTPHAAPQVGSMGVAPPAKRGRLGCMPPDEHGGNLDTRHLTEGAVALFPVHVPGAHFSLGDVHAAQGDGEVGGTGLEVGARVTVRLTLLKKGSTPLASSLTEWALVTPAVALPRLGAGLLQAPRDGARLVTTGFAPDLLTASRKAITAMMAVLKAHRPELTTEEAYMICSMAADLRISQAVDLPHYSVAAHLPLAVLH